MTDLSEFGGGVEREPPRFRPTRPVRIPYKDHRRQAGQWGRVAPDRPWRAFATQRDSDDHRLWKHDAYAISVAALDKLQALDVVMVYVVETDTGDVYEYELDQFLDGPLVESEDLDDKGDRQRYVPRDEAKGIYRNHAASFFQPEKATPDDIEFHPASNFGGDEE